MKIPAGLSYNGEVFKGEVLLENARGDGLVEAGIQQNGNHFTCFALTAEDDAIVPYIATSSGVVEFVDIVVDGILRASHSNDKGTLKNLKKSFDWVSGQVKQGNRTTHKQFQMQVKKRNTENERHPIDGKEPSAVSSIEFQIFRKEPKKEKKTSPSDSDSESESSSSSEDTQDLGDAQRAPTFENHANWWNLNPFAGKKGLPPPPFEVGFVNAKSVSPVAKQRVLKKWPGGFKLWASFKFLLFSAEDFHKLGFPDTQPYHGLSWDAAQKMKDAGTNTNENASTKESTAKIGTTNPRTTSTNDVAPASPAPENGPDEQNLDRIKDEDGLEKPTQTGIPEGTTTAPTGINKNSPACGNIGLENADCNGSNAATAESQEKPTNLTVVKPQEGYIVLSDSDEEDVKMQDIQAGQGNISTSFTVEVEKHAGDDKVSKGSSDVQKRPTTMPGIEGAPANKAWNNPNRTSTPGTDNLSQLVANRSGANHHLSLNTSVNLSEQHEVNEETQKEQHTRHVSPGVDSKWVPMTPPPSSKKKEVERFDDFDKDNRYSLPTDFDNVSELALSRNGGLDLCNGPTGNLMNMSFGASRTGRISGDAASQSSTSDNLFATIEHDPMEIEFNNSINLPAPQEDEDMADATDVGPDLELKSPLLQNTTVAKKDGSVGQNQSISRLVSPSELTSERGQAGSETRSDTIVVDSKAGQTPAKDSTIKETSPDHAKVNSPVATVSSDNKTKPSDHATAEDHSKPTPPTKMTTTETGEKPAVGLGIQQDSPSETADFIKVAAPIKPTKEQKTKTPAKEPATKPNKSTNSKSSASQPEQGDVKAKEPASKPTKSSNAKAAASQPEQGDAKSKKAAPKASKAPKATPKAAAQTSTEASASKPKAKPRPKVAPATAAEKRKANKITSAPNEGGANKTNQSPALKQTDFVQRETEAAELRMKAAAEKKKALEQAIEAAKNAKERLKKANEINQQAKELEEHNAALEAELRKLQAFPGAESNA